MMFDTALWNWTSPIWLVALSIGLVYALAFGGKTGARPVLALIALAMLVFAFVSPIGVLANGYLFSAHMIQHLILLLVIPVLLLLSLPEATVTSWFARPGLNRAGLLLSVPAFGWICGIGAMWFWHIPSFCSASTQSFWLGGFRDATFVLAGLAFWWPVYSPVHRFRIPPLAGIVYLFSACSACTLLGIYITFTTISVCPVFANPVDRIGIMQALYSRGFTPMVDQNLGGLLMWVPPCSFYVGAIVSLLHRWYHQFEEHPVADSTTPRIEA